MNDSDEQQHASASPNVTSHCDNPRQASKHPTRSQQYAGGGEHSCNAKESVTNEAIRDTGALREEDFKLEEMISKLYKSREKYGDWKDNSESWRNIEQSLLQRSVRDAKVAATSTEWKYRNPYSFSDCDRLTHWAPSYDTYSQKRMHHVQTSGEGKKNSFLLDIREYLANYQETCGTPRTEYSFTSLIRVMGQMTGRSLLALLHVLINVAPIAEIFLYILRFLLDKVINIQNTDDFQQCIIKYAILAVQLVSIYACLIFIFGFIVLPILDMVLGIMVKVILYN